MKQIYLDNAATTQVDSKVFLAMKPYFFKKYGNASEPHRMGQEARLAVEQAREKVADFLGVKQEEIIFTSGATESINLAHKGLIEALNFKNPHIITSSVEHKAVLETCKYLENKEIATVTYLPVNEYGLVNIQNLEKAITDQTVLVSIMYANNEVGTIQPIKEIGALLKKQDHKIYFHTDATQAIQYLDCSVDNLGVDLLSFSGHKIYAPKGVGALYIRKGTPLKSQMRGGGQEGGLRAGTENVPYLVGLGKAVEMIYDLRFKNDDSVKKLQSLLIEEVLKIPGVKLTGHPAERLPHIASFIVEGVEGESLVLLLSDKGISASTGSACTASDLVPSHVLSAMGIKAEDAHGSLRFSLGKDTTEQDIRSVVEVLPGIIDRLRRMAPKL